MIAVDWGGSNLRAYRLDDGGQVVERRRGEVGALACEGRYAETLAAVIGDWDDRLVVMCGMVGARGGWVEAPYVPCPAGVEALAAGMVELTAQASHVRALAGRSLWCAPGMCDLRDAAADVMRGEETQVVGLLEQLVPGVHVACLPGTHSKWVRVEDGVITAISTAMTGEIYGLLRGHSILACGMPQAEPALDPVAFDAGLAQARAGAGLLHDVFGVRTAALFGRFDGPALPSYLSGLLVGHELQPALARAGDRPVHLVGSDALLDRYARALSAHGRIALRHREDLAAAGLHRLARARFG